MPWRPLLLVLLVAVITVARAEEPAREVPPVILRAPRPWTPLETAGTGLAPTVALRLTVSPRGVVSDLEVLSIEPPSPYDALFRDTVRTTIGRWRFAPALLGTEPVARQLSWSLEFLPAERAAWSPAVATPGMASLVRDEDPDVARLVRIFTLPHDRQLAHLQALSRTAEKYLRPGTRRELAEGGVVVVTDHPDPDAARSILGTVHAAAADTFRVLGAGIPLQPPRLPLLVYVYWSRTQYLDLVRSVDGVLETSGYFCPPGLIAVHAELPTQQHILSVLIHETVHAAMYRSLVRPGHVLPRWLSEGTADYLGYSRIAKGRLVPGDHRGTQVFRAQASLWRGRSLSQLEIDDVRQRIRRGDALSVSAIVNADRETFYGKNMALYYAQAWILVHMLRHGQADWSEDAFPRFLLYVAEGYSAAAALRHVYAVTPTDLEAPYREYARAF